jgi:NAD(P)H-quinone oxidoreductase subunit 5
MNSVIPWLALPILCLVCISLLPRGTANAAHKLLRTWVPRLLAVQLLLAAWAAVTFLMGSRSGWVDCLWESPNIPALQLSIYYDWASSAMLVLVSFVGFVVSRYSVRYLDGEADQGNYFRWLSLTIGGVSLMVIVGNLLWLCASWVLVSVGLHHLLLHYGERPGARRAAWTKFTFSRIGDICFVLAILLTYSTFGTLEIAELLRQLEFLQPGNPLAPQVQAIAWLLMAVAITKSAQFPFHVWLPDTMETPTPVSALMHAGVVNAGGYLLIRLSPLMTHAPVVLHVLAAIGVVTIIFAAVVMMTQTNIKRSLAFSTVAQMGFMMLQCGLGAFSAAMLHILAHSLYKAHAFLGSGSVVAASVTSRGPKPVARRGPDRWLSLLAAAIVASVSLAIAAWMTGIHIHAEPGGWIAVYVLFLAMMSWTWQVAAHHNWRLLAIAAGITIGLCTLYFGTFLLIDNVSAISAAPLVAASTPTVLLCVIALAFTFLFVLHSMILQNYRPAWLTHFYVHASNNFYVDALYRRLYETISRS